MTFTSGVLVGLIFVAAVAGLIVINEIDVEKSIQNDATQGIPQNSEDQIVKALNDFDTKLGLLFSDLKKEIGL